MPSSKSVAAAGPVHELNRGGRKAESPPQHSREGGVRRAFHRRSGEAHQERPVPDAAHLVAGGPGLDADTQGHDAIGFTNVHVEGLAPRGPDYAAPAIMSRRDASTELLRAA